MVSNDALEASKLPDGLGRDLSDEQLRALMKLNPKDRKRRAAAVFIENGKPCRKFARLGTKKHLETEQEIEFRAIKETLLRNGDPDHYVSLFAWTDPETGHLEYPQREIAVTALEVYGVPNKELDALSKKMKSRLCGALRLAIIPTHQHIKHVFDPQAELYEMIPGNPLWNDHIEQNRQDWVANHSE
jgi:hypothetical protein